MRSAAVLALVLVGWAAAGCGREAPGPSGGAVPAEAGLPTATLTLAGRPFTVELAFTREARQQGLMFRQQLAPEAGMLFIFDQPGELSFWMKNTLIDLDILFLEADGTIARISTMTAPRPAEPLRNYGSGSPVLYALEASAGTAARLGLAAGQKIDLPRQVRTIIADPD